MPSDRRVDWEVLDAVLDAALDAGLDASLPLGDEDQGLLARLCHGDGDLQSEAHHLLQRMAGSGDALDTPLDRLVPGLLDELESGSPRVESEAVAGSTGEEPSGRVLDRYRLIEVLGRGGMGVVYRAERADRHFEKQVALKLMPRGLESAERERRFRRERQILAGLEHPGIARLLDGGMTEEGYPYLVMELVEGEPIDQYCERHDLPLERRVELFLDVCDAVEHAHRRLVVHRDLKPNNCLVTAEGGVKLLDFGIAKILEEDPLDDGGERTLLQPMTPQFAAPEQLANRPISAATDVYALGGLLYRLLCGTPPLDLDRLDVHQVRDRVLHHEPAPPSERAARWRRRLRGDLDVIACKALRRDPEERYGSVAELALDLRRHLDGHPIAARPSSRFSRTLKFVTRHRTASVAAAAFAALLGVGIGLVAWQGRVAARERDLALVEATRAQRIARFTTRLLEAGNVTAKGAGERTARELLDDAEASIRGELSEEPVVRASMLRVMASSYLSLGEYEKAERLAVEAIEVLAQSSFTDEVAVARLQTTLAQVRKGRGDFDGLAPLLQSALTTLGRHERLDSIDAAMVHRELGDLSTKSGRYEESIEHHREAQRLFLRHAEPREAASEMTAIASGLHNLGRLDEGLEQHRAALDLLVETLGDDHPSVHAVVNNMALTHRALGRYAEAEALLRDVLRADEDRFGESSSLIAPPLTNLARVLMDQNRPGDAAPYARRAAALVEGVLDRDHPTRLGAQMNLASVELALGNHEVAIRLYRDGLERWVDLTGDDSSPSARTRSLLGAALVEIGSLGEAAVLLERAIEQQRLSAVTELYLAESLVALARVRQGQGRCEEPERLLDEALVLLERSLPTEHWKVGQARALYGRCPGRDLATQTPETPSP